MDYESSWEGEGSASIRDPELEALYFETLLVAIRHEPKFNIELIDGSFMCLAIDMPQEATDAFSRFSGLYPCPQGGGACEAPQGPCWPPCAWLSPP